MHDVNCGAKNFGVRQISGSYFNDDYEEDIEEAEEICEEEKEEGEGE